METKKKEKKDIGALWLKAMDDGNKYLAGKVELNAESYEIVVFKNSYKTKDNHPDYRIYLRKPMREKSAIPAINPHEDIPF